MQLSSFITTILVALAGTAVAVPSGSEPFPGVANLRLPANGKSNHNEIKPSGTATPFASASGFQTSARPSMSTGTPSFASASGSASASAAAASSSAGFNSNSAKQIAAAGQLCPDLCQLQAESCTVALPTNRKFW